MRHERLLAFAMITIGCAFATIGLALAAQRPDAGPLAATVGTLGMAFAIFSAATYVIRHITEKSG
jgi:hypothetical protein